MRQGWLVSEQRVSDRNGAESAAAQMTDLAPNAHAVRAEVVRANVIVYKAETLRKLLALGVDHNECSIAEMMFDRVLDELAAIQNTYGDVLTKS